MSEEHTPGDPASRDLCFGNVTGEEMLVRIDVPSLPTDGSSAHVTEDGLAEAAASDVRYDGEGFSDPADVVIPDARWAFAVGPADAPVKILVSPAPGDTSGREYVVKLESQVELHRITFGVSVPDGTAIGDYRFLGCSSQGFLAGADYATCETFTTVCPPPSEFVGGSVDLCNSFAVGPDPDDFMSNPDAVFLTLQGQLEAEGDPSDGTLVNITDIQGNLIDDDGDGLVDNPGKVTLGILEVPVSAAGVTPSITLDGASELAATSIFVLPGGDAFAPETVGLNGTAATSEDSDGDRVSNDTDNCVFARERRISSIAAASTRRSPTAAETSASAARAATTAASWPRTTRRSRASATSWSCRWFSPASRRTRRRTRAAASRRPPVDPRTPRPATSST